MKYQNIREEEIKNKIAQDYFWLYDCSKIIGNVDFCVSMLQSKNDLEHESLLWAEAKKSASDIYISIVQLILTIGKARTFDKFLPPAFLGAFDGEKIAFIPYSDIHDIFYINDFNWNVAPSNHETKEFALIYEKVRTIIDSKTLLYYFIKDDNDLNRFIKTNFAVFNGGLTKTKIDKNNFMVIYNKWLEMVKPTIQVDDWNEEKKNGIIDGDFYLADLLSIENKTLKDKLFVLLKSDEYELNLKIPEIRRTLFMRIGFSDNQKAHTQFWNRYERPPKEEYWEYIINRRDLLVPQDVRERKGSFFTPQIWVELSQKYLADVLGEDWQDEYYVWDCAAGTGNLFAGLTNKYNIWASTLDKADVDVMKDRIQNGANLLESHVFQFDFLNDDFSKLQQGLQDIINDEKKRKKLIIYINPPYAEAASSTTTAGTGQNKQNVATIYKTSEKYKPIIGRAINEIFAQFLVRIYHLIPHAKLATFGTLKYVNSQNFIKFRDYFFAEYKNGFVCRANTFDNVNGKFPIGFLIWDLEKKKKITDIKVDVYESNSEVTQCWFQEEKVFYTNDKGNFIVDWIRNYFDKKSERIGYLRFQGTDFQTNSNAFFTSCPTENDIRESKITPITQKNIIEMCVYLSVRHCIEATWLNDRDQFLYPNDKYRTDFEFQNDCLAFALFHKQNRIQSKHGVNNWIPFTEYLIGARDKFQSSFMTDFIEGKNELSEIVSESPILYLFDKYSDGGGGSGTSFQKNTKRVFSEAAKNVFKAGRELWKYYHTQPNVNVNASLYDIKEYFKGRNEKGKIYHKSKDKEFNSLEKELTAKLKVLAQKIASKVYEYEFLKKIKI